MVFKQHMVYTHTGGEQGLLGKLRGQHRDSLFLVYSGGGSEGGVRREGEGGSQW